MNKLLKNIHLTNLLNELSTKKYISDQQAIIYLDKLRDHLEDEYDYEINSSRF